jgi:hypothetical protein
MLQVFNLSPPLFTPLQTAYVHHAMHVRRLSSSPA